MQGSECTWDVQGHDVREERAQRDTTGCISLLTVAHPPLVLEPHSVSCLHCTLTSSHTHLLAHPECLAHWPPGLHTCMVPSFLPNTHPQLATQSVVCMFTHTVLCTAPPFFAHLHLAHSPTCTYLSPTFVHQSFCLALRCTLIVSTFGPWPTWSCAHPTCTPTSSCTHASQFTACTHILARSLRKVLTQRYVLSVSHTFPWSIAHLHLRTHSVPADTCDMHVQFLERLTGPVCENGVSI